MFVEVFNPFQGGLAVGLGGVIFKLAPILWFFVGMSRSSENTIRKLSELILFSAIIQSLFGLYQIFYGFSDVEKYWVAAGGGTQSAGTSFRPFGTMLSFSEYISILVMGCSIAWVNILTRKYIYIVPFILILIVIFLSSSRTGFITICTVIITTWAVQGKTYQSWVPRLFIALALIIWGMVVGIEKVQTQKIGMADQAQVLMNHQIKGLSDPLGKESTGGTHIDLVVQGILKGFQNPVGFGLGITTIANGKFNNGASTEFGNVIGGTETDYGDMFLSLGFVGGILYILMIIRTYTTIGRYWHNSRDNVALTMIGILISCSGRWASGEHYSQSMIFWFLVGAIDRKIFVVEREKFILI